MTISTEVRKAGPFIGNGSASSFPFAFKVFKAADLIVVRRQDNIGVETTLVLDSDYHVTLNVNQDTTPGGVVALTGGALADGFTLIVSSELPYLQTTDLTNQGGFYPKVITNALDRLTIFCQQLLEITGRTLKLPITAPTNISAEIPLPNPSELIAWNETGTGLTTVSPQSLVTSIAYGSATADLFAGDGVTTTFPLTTNPASVNNLDVSIGGYSQRPVQDGVGDYSWNGGASITFVTPPPAPSSPGDKNVLVRYMQAIPVSDSEALHAQTREALRRSYAEAGFNLVDGSFETGGTLGAAADVLLQESTGVAYGWTGALPKVVAPGTDPTEVAGYVPRPDVALRNELQPWRDDHVLIADILMQDGVTDETAAFNVMTKSAIDNSKAVDLGTRKVTVVKNGYINDYTIGQAVAGQYQREHVKSFTGRGGKFDAPVFKAPATATPTDYVLRGNNSAGVVIGNFRVNGSGLSRGADFSFIGNGAGDVAPSNGNEIYNVWCEDFVDVGLNLNQCHDSDIHGIFTRNGSGADPIAVSLLGSGGFLSMRDSVIYGGKLEMDCQNGSLSNVVMQRLGLQNLSYNNILLNSCHFIGADSGIRSNILAGASGCEHLTLNECYFPTDIGTVAYIQGRFWKGATINGGRFTSATIVGSISAAAGAGSKPLFEFNGVTFVATPIFDETNARIKCRNCRLGDGSLYNYDSESDPASPVVSGLSVGVKKHASESLSVDAGGWSRFAGNVAGVAPQDSYGSCLGWNYSAGRGEVAFVYNKAAGSEAGIDFIDGTGGSTSIKWRMTNASLSPAIDNTQSAGTAGTRYSVVYAGTGAINTSDAREKTEPLNIDDAVLDAWGDVHLVAFQWLSSVAQKGDSARWHFGVIAQQVRDAFAVHGLDGTKYGLLCYDEWDAEYAPVIVSEVVDGEIVSKETGEMRVVRDAGNRWGIRPDQCLFVEASYQRRNYQRLLARIEALEAK